MRRRSDEKEEVSGKEKTERRARETQGTRERKKTRRPRKKREAGSTPTNFRYCLTLGSVFERDRTKRVLVSWSSQAVFEMAASGVHARQALVNEPSGARFSSARS